MAQSFLNSVFSNELIRLGLVAVVAVIVAFVLVGRRRRARRQNGQAVPLAEGRSQAPSTWAPPPQPAPPAPAAGPSLAVSVMIVNNDADVLQVSWQAVNAGSSPLAVQWGPPVVLRSGEFLELRYCHDATEAPAPFQAPAARTCGPGEVLSRSLTLSRAATGGDCAGLSVTVVLGFGPAAERAAAQSDQDRYVSWQHTARSRPRPIPAPARRQPAENT